MKAWLFKGVGEPLELIERETPKARRGEALVEVRAAGMCHSDVGFLDGTITSVLGKIPIVLGHEVAGVVTEVGDDVTCVRPGDAVVLNKGWDHVFDGQPGYFPGVRADGGFATHCVTAASALVPLPEGVGFVQGAAATDAGQTAYGALMKSGELQPGQRVGVIGLGGLGLTGARIAVLNGCEVYGAEPRRQVWDNAKGQGVTEVFSDVSGFNDLDLDLIVDFAGYGTTTSGAITAVRPGGLVVQVGVGVEYATISSKEMTTKFVTLRGMRGANMPGALEAVLDYIRRGDLEIVVSTVGFEEIPQSLERLRHGGVVGRLVAVPDKA